jgi:cell wall-associated NlpC family hydrolase
MPRLPILGLMPRSPRPLTPRLPIAVAVTGCLLAVVLAGCGGASSTTGTRSSASAGSHEVAAVAVGAPPPAGAPAKTKTREVADPQEGESFPAPASARKRSAATPAKAGEVVVAAGAPSDAEVRHELEQMQAAERSARSAGGQHLTAVPGGESIAGSGALAIPQNVPEVIQRVIAGANEIADYPYVFGGGHASFVDSAYDCSGSVSYALAAGGLLNVPETSGELEHWGAAGPGRYISVYANAGHAYMYVDGILYDTAGRSGIYASRWQVGSVDNSGFVVRHYPGL